MDHRENYLKEENMAELPKLLLLLIHID